MSTKIKGLRFIVWMYTKRLIRECLKAIWKVLNKKRYVGKYPRVKKWLMIVAWIVVDCYIVFTAFDYNVKEVYIVERVGAVVETQETETATLDTSNGAEEQQISNEIVPLTVGEKICNAFPDNCELMVAIAKAESGLNPNAINYTNSNGTIDVGLMMINSCHGYDTEFLLDVDNNLKIAKKIYDTQGIVAWSAYNNGAYLKFLES